MINFFYGLLIGLGLKLFLVGSKYLTQFLGLDAAIANLLKNIPETRLFVDYLGLIVIITSVLLCVVYHKTTPKYLKNSDQRRIPSRLASLFFSWLIISLLATVYQNQVSPSFLWILNLFYPDTIGHIAGIPINLLALSCLVVYSTYAIIIGKKRKSINTTLHLTAILSFLILSYNDPSAFFLFWLIQSISLLIQAKKLGTIVEPRK